MHCTADHCSASACTTAPQLLFDLQPQRITTAHTTTTAHTIQSLVQGGGGRMQGFEGGTSSGGLQGFGSSSNNSASGSTHGSERGDRGGLNNSAAGASTWSTSSTMGSPVSTSAHSLSGYSVGGDRSGERSAERSSTSMSPPPSQRLQAAALPAVPLSVGPVKERKSSVTATAASGSAKGADDDADFFSSFGVGS
eukprot:6820-Heterococcus_DN1.PRE.1